jgi:polysaccharide export outer membrane protein
VPVAPALPVTPDRDRPIGPGDTVSYEIVEDNVAPILKRVSDTGDLDVPIIGHVHAAGRSCADVAAQITHQLVPKYYIRATVKLAIEQINPKKVGTTGKVFLSGEVKVTGPEEIAAGETLSVSGAVVKAGGGTQFAELRHVKLTRKDKTGRSTTIIIDERALLEKGEMDKDQQLMDGDFINVPRRLFTT